MGAIELNFGDLGNASRAGARPADIQSVATSAAPKAATNGHPTRNASGLAALARPPTQISLRLTHFKTSLPPC